MAYWCKIIIRTERLYMGGDYMTTINEALERECLEILIDQNPMLDKDSIIALLDDIKNNAIKNNCIDDLKEIILNHKY